MRRPVSIRDLLSEDIMNRLFMAGNDFYLTTNFCIIKNDPRLAQAINRTRTILESDRNIESQKISTNPVDYVLENLSQKKSPSPIGYQKVSTKDVKKIILGIVPTPNTTNQAITQHLSFFDCKTLVKIEEAKPTPDLENKILQRTTINYENKIFLQPTGFNDWRAIGDKKTWYYLKQVADEVYVSEKGNNLQISFFKNSDMFAISFLPFLGYTDIPKTLNQDSQTFLNIFDKLKSNL